MNTVKYLLHITVMCLLVNIVGTTFSYSAIFVDENVERIQANKCVTVDFVTQYKPSFSPEQKPRVFSINIHTAEDAGEILTVLYGCDIYENESKFNPDNEYQDGTVYLIWGDTGKNADGSPITIFTLLSSGLPTITKMSFDERVYSTLKEALDSPEMERYVTEFGAEKMYVQAFTLKGVDKGLFD